MTLRLTCCAVALLVAGSATPGAMARDCKPGNNVGGTLAAAGNPCTPAPAPNARKPVARSAPKEPETRTPGTYKYGNTTVHIGGSVSTDVNVRGR